MATQVFKLQGMSCAGCARNIEKVIAAVPGVPTGSVNFGAEQATVTYAAQHTSVDKIQAAIAAAHARMRRAARRPATAEAMPAGSSPASLSNAARRRRSSESCSARASSFVRWCSLIIVGLRA